MSFHTSYLIDAGTGPNTVILKTNAKIIKLQSVKLQELVKACQDNSRKAQKLLYEQYAPLFLSICYRYMKQKEASEDAMITAFYTIFKKINTYNGQGSFEGWMKKIVVNTCLMTLRKNQLIFSELADHQEFVESTPSAIERLFEDDLHSLIGQLPDGYRTVFNLYVIEGYKHREIADMLGISINTSKSQLIQAKQRLRELIHQQPTQGNSYEA